MEFHASSWVSSSDKPGCVDELVDLAIVLVECPLGDFSTRAWKQPAQWPEAVDGVSGGSS